ncbi:TRAP transporter small permease subunit [Psychrobacter sp. FDAARGOS_221]|uniref:TRAP transporter small permease subunit n=1 Tax=Psychrobacter sp. FDAARGOS_221 TaxID=1975705 RepID=UPI000BB569F4|nr:TRAP transporter small permease subunit [Psychrobacter sp. FDAARGOS_221]PNK59899.1 C4-dicarboxylate ABC transporter permease [Psychrobacter sp. FDAARGOS_221]
MLKKIEKAFDAFGTAIGGLTSIVLVLMIVNVFYDVVMRYFFNIGSIGFQELEWHLFSIIIMLGMSYTLQQDGHVRVDVFYDNLSVTKQAFINIIGTLLFIIPVAIVIGYGSIDYVIESYQSAEASGNPGGLTHRWIIKSLIPLSFLFLIISAIGFIVKQINILQEYKSGQNTLKGEQS